MLYVYKRKFTKTARFLRRFLAAVIAAIFVLSGGLLGPMPVRAEGVKTYTWVGPEEGGYWHTPGNWETAPGVPATELPGEGDTVVISGPTTVVESVYDTNRVILQCAGNLTVSGGVLNTTSASTISGKLVNNGKVTIEGASGSLTLSGGGEGSGGFDVGGGKKLKFTGGIFTVDGNINDTGNSASLEVSGAGTKVSFNGSYNIIGGNGWNRCCGRVERYSQFSGDFYQ